MSSTVTILEAPQPTAESASYQSRLQTKRVESYGLGSRTNVIEISEEQEPILEPEKKRRRKKKKKKKSKRTESINPTGDDAAEEACPSVALSTPSYTLLQFEGMPQAWVDCKTVMAGWLLVTFLIFGLCLITIPIGCLLAFFACFLYFSRRRSPSEYGGKYYARMIYFIAFWAWIYDMVIFSLTLFAWVILVYGDCGDYDQNICDFRVSTGYFISAQMCMVFVHASFSFAAFLKMRDCCNDIILDEKEAKERFVDMEKQIYEEFRRKRAEEMPPKKKKAGTSSKTPRT